MGYYTSLADLGARMKTNRNRERSAHAREADRSEAPFSCPSCYDTSIVAMTCPACAQPMVRFDEAIVLRQAAGRRAWAGWPYLGVALAAVGYLIPWAIAESGNTRSLHIVRGPHDDPASMFAVWFVLGLPALLVIALALRAWSRSTAPGRRARKAAAALRALDVELAATLHDFKRARVRGVARVLTTERGRELFVEDSSGRVRVEIVDLNAYGAQGAVHAIADGDEIEVAGDLAGELGGADGYRGRQITYAFAAGATVLVG